MEEQLLAKVKALEEELSKLKASNGVPANQKLKSRDYSTTKYVPKNPLGMKDHHPEDMAIRQAFLHKIRSIFQLHGAVEISTPIVELKSTLTGKYGEDSKLIYDLKDQGGEILALRYDLTVPFARYCAQHKVESIKRYHIDRVYRRDRPVMAKGRYREFFQCDLDIAGTQLPMSADAECLKIVCDCISTLGISFKLKVNHRKLLDGIFKACGVKEELLRPICSAVDKLDKLSWEEVKKEMLEKGLDDSKADKIYSYVKQSGSAELVEKLLKDVDLTAVGQSSEALEEMRLLFSYLKAFKVLDKVVFDLSLARGLDYYTGMIFEAVGVSEGTGDNRVGSIAGGGRYDELVGMFKKKKKQVPCVGLSLGIERLFVLYSKKETKEKTKVTPTQVLVCGIGAKSAERQFYFEKRLELLSTLWEQGICAETVSKLNPKALTQFQLCEDKQIPIAVIVAPTEYAKGVVKLRIIESREEEEVQIENLAERVAALLKE